MKTKIGLTKQLLSILLCICMVLSYVPLTAFAAEQHTHPICGAAHTDVGEHTDNCSGITWKKWNNETIMPTEAGAYYLANNVTLSSTWEIPKDVEISLCLNGYSISGNSAVRVISIEKTATLNLCDCSSLQTGKITEGNAKNLSGGGVYVPTNSTFNLYGGSITNNKASYQGGGIFIFGGTFHMYGGTISNNSANIAAGVYNVNDGTAYMYAGAISENVSIDRCGGIWSSGLFHMQGGIISENNSGKDDGDGVYVNGGSFVMSGGEISNNDSVSDKSISVPSLSKFMIFGKPVIKDAIYLGSSQHGTAYITVCGVLDDEVKIPATNRSVGELLAKGTDYLLTDTDIAKFTSTNGKVILDSMNNRLVICDDSHPDYEDGTCKTCDAECVHSFVYETNENVITEKCNANSNCGHNATATLTVDSNVSTIYSGNEIKPLKVEYSDDWFGGELAVSYTNNTNVGTNASASGSITINEVTYTATKSFEIKAADISNATLTLNPESGKYTGSAYTPSVTVTLTGFGTLVENTDFTVSWDKTGFTNADTYTAIIEGKGNFTGKVTKTFIVNTASLANIEVKQVGTLTYDGGKALTPTISASAVAVNNQTVTFAYSIDQENVGSYKDILPTFTNAGEYTVYYKVSAPNHDDAYGSFTVTIDKQTVNKPTIASKPYTGSAQTADVPASDLYTVGTNNGGTIVGKYDVVLTLKDSKNYKWETTDNAAVTLKFEITQAKNGWRIISGIQGWTYGESAKAHIRQSSFGEVVRIYTGTAFDGTEWNSTEVPVKAGDYTVTFTVEQTDNYTGLKDERTFSINKATYDMSGAKWNYTEAFDYDGKEHKVEVVGLPTGVTVSSYTGNTATKVGEYTATVTLTYDSDNYNAPVLNNLAWEIKNDWTPAVNVEYTVSAPNASGWMNTDFIVTAADGYELSYSNAADSIWSKSLHAVNEGIGFVNFCVRNIATGAISLPAREGYQLDKTNPTGKVSFDERNGWETFLNTISFGLFYKNEVTVKAVAADELSGVASIEYAASNKAMTLDEVKAITDWTAMPESGAAATVEDAKQFVYYIRITDKAGNVTYLSTDGAEYDTTAPAISGIENGNTYYTTQSVAVTDKNLDTITLNGDPVTGIITLEGNKEATYTIVATDQAKNSTTVTVTMKPVATVGTPIDGITEDEVKSTDKDTIQEVIDQVDELLGDEDMTDDEKKALEEIKGEAEKLIEKIEKVIGATDTENTEKVEDVTADTVTPEDKTDLENAKADLEKALEENGDNYTDDEKKAIEDEIKRINDALKVIGNVQAVENQINNLPENITKDDTDDVDAAKKAYDGLTDYEKTLIDPNTKKKLDAAIKSVEEANKPADTDSPATGDNSNLPGLFALMLGSLAAMFAILFGTKKKKKAEDK